MLIDKTWRVLTIGDGDLSFSASIITNIKPQNLVATVYDSEPVLLEKYANQSFNQLIDAGISVLTNFDVTDQSTWQGLTSKTFDLVIFQFPLVPNNVNVQQHQLASELGSSNTINRWLLHQFLVHCFDCFLAPDGQRLAVITSKDVKPYRQWAIETSLTQGLAVDYIGQQHFDFDVFPEYQIRNVDRDKFVKETQAISYFYSDKTQPELSLLLTVPNYCRDNRYCSICRVGPIETTADWLAHNNSKRHRQMSEYESQCRHRLAANKIVSV